MENLTKGRGRNSILGDRMGMPREGALVSSLLLTKSNFREEGVYLTYNSRSQVITERSQGRNLKAGLLAVPHSVTANQGAHFTAKEARQEPCGGGNCWQAGRQIYPQLSSYFGFLRQGFSI